MEMRLDADESECQLVFPAAGKSPLALELLERNHSKINRIFEIDISGMEEKKKLYDRICPDNSKKIICITADITSPNIASLLNKFFRNRISVRHTNYNSFGRYQLLYLETRNEKYYNKFSIGKEEKYHYLRVHGTL
jgi:hypothetical protein